MALCSHVELLLTFRKFRLLWCGHGKAFPFTLCNLKTFIHEGNLKSFVIITYFPFFTDMLRFPRILSIFHMGLWHYSSFSYLLYLMNNREQQDCRDARLDCFDMQRLLCSINCMVDIVHYTIVYLQCGLAASYFVIYFTTITCTISQLPSTCCR